MGDEGSRQPSGERPAPNRDPHDPRGDVEAEEAAVRAQHTALDTLAQSTAAVKQFNVESARSLPHVSASLASRAKMLATLRAQIVALDQRAARCRQRAIALAERSGVDVSELSLHDPDAEVLEGN